MSRARRQRQRQCPAYLSFLGDNNEWSSKLTGEQKQALRKDLTPIVQLLPVLRRHEIYCPVWKGQAEAECRCIESARRIHRLSHYWEEELGIPHP